MNATVMCEKCGKPLGVFDGNTCADCSKIDAIQQEIRDCLEALETGKNSVFLENEYESKR